MMDRARAPRMARLRGEEHEGLHPDGLVTVTDKEAEGRGRHMIKVTRLSGDALYLNVMQIESMECIPETKIKMMNGYYYLVKDTAESVEEQMLAFYHSCIAFEKRDKIENK